MSKKISELDAVVSLDGSEFIAVVQAGETKKATINDVGGPTIYTGDGSLNGDRVVSMDGHDLEFRNSLGNAMLYVSEEDFNSYLNAIDIGSGANSQISLLANGAVGDVAFILLTSNGSNNVQIVGDANDNSVNYTADTHTFNGVLNLPTQAAPASPNDGDIWREDNTNTGLKIRINGVTKTITVS